MADLQDNVGSNLVERDFLNILAHDLKAPMSSVKGFIELIGNVGELNEDQARYADRAVQGLLRMGRIVDDVLELARLESNEDVAFVPLKLHPIINESVETLAGFAELRSVKIHVSLTQGADSIIGDARMLAILISNLLSNAIKYNHEKGSVWINAYRQRAFVRVDIRDNGFGIHDADLDKIFEPFYRAKDKTHQEGTGLGLAISQRIVRRHRGELTVVSKYGEGTTFSFTVPAVTSLTYNDHSLAGEHSDGMDDALQDSSEKLEIDSSHDEI